ncbi:MAG: stage 0 sporulation family protein [Oscillospiraceae bacterium]|nr:stage 0 sporulation family protein [Oscillospiraceae bacterium]
MENNEYFTEKIAPKKHNENRPVEKRANDRPRDNRRRDFPRKPKSESSGAPSIDLTLTADDNSPKVEIIGVRFKDVGKVYYFSPKGVKFKRGESAIVETARGVECGEVVLPNRDFPQSGLVSPLKDIIRKATEADFKQLEQNAEKEREIMKTFTDKIREHNLEMKPIDVEYTFDGSKIMFFFTSDGRVDFRDLVKDLAFIYRTRIELRQIGVRDEAKMLGGLGICGRPFCCSSFLGDFQPVSIKMAKEQSLSLNPTKISGTCGRLMCCLKYEQNCYEDFLRTTPKVGAYVETEDGRGTVQEVNLLTGILKIKLDKKPDVPLVVNKEEVKIIKDGKIRVDRDEMKALKKLEE